MKVVINFVNELIVRSLKVFDIGYITVIYFGLGILLAKTFDILFGKYDEKEESKKSLWQQTAEIICMMWMYGVIIYIVRNLVELIPFPFDHIHGFDHLKLKELKNAAVFTFVFLYFQDYFKTKIQVYYNSIKLF